jgi:hypothetical protein
MIADPNREAALYQAAAQLSGSERAAFLEAVCRDDPALRKRLEGQFSTQEKNQEVLAETALDEKSTLKADSKDELANKAIGTTIGRYKVWEMIGEGGFGLVCVAEQKEPVKRNDWNQQTNSRKSLPMNSTL